ncbi:MAG: hypothetical protein E6J89_15120 [Deltaproteobacteria bacterium]|nr:MAG: hypothetical protein E6J89_15120 [Deltaproteobacteria bacterium]
MSFGRQEKTKTIASHREIALVKVKEIKGFFEEGLWQIDLDDLSRIRRYLYQQLRILNLVIKGFIGNRCLLLASALTYASLLSLVPLLALMFSILKGLGVQNRLEPILNHSLHRSHQRRDAWSVRIGGSDRDCHLGDRQH